MIYRPVPFSGLGNHPYNHAEMLFLRMLLEGIDRALERRWFQIINTSTDTVIQPTLGAESLDTMIGEKGTIATSHEVLLETSINGAMHGPDGLCRFSVTFVISDIGHGYGPHTLKLRIGEDRSVTYRYHVARTAGGNIIYEMDPQHATPVHAAA